MQDEIGDMTEDFLALVVRKGPGRTFQYDIERRVLPDLPEGDVTIRVQYSTINYKDVLSAQGNPAITRHFPHTPGIDAAGIVLASRSDRFKEGDPVMVISHAMGMSVPGGFGQVIRVPEAWVMEAPSGLSLDEAMAFGTPGYTAALSVEALIAAGVDLNGAKVAVTGATGGVGCLSVLFLSGLGCAVTAVTGKDGAADFLTALGAAEVVSRTQFEDRSGRNLLLPVWDAGIDVAGGDCLSTLIKGLKNEGAAIATGLAQGTAFETSILPFILRGARLIGINAENTSLERRSSVWSKMAASWKPAALARSYRVIPMNALPDALSEAAQGKVLGRTVIDLR